MVIGCESDLQLLPFLNALCQRGSYHAAERLKRSMITSAVSRAGLLGQELEDVCFLAIPPRTSGSGMDSFCL